MDLLNRLRDNKSIKRSTIESLISYGFDSNEALIALDFDSDLDQMNDISRQQKQVLRQLYKQFIDVSQELINKSITGPNTEEKVKIETKVEPKTEDMNESNDEILQEVIQEMKTISVEVRVKPIVRKSNQWFECTFDDCRQRFPQMDSIEEHIKTHVVVKDEPQVANTGEGNEPVMDPMEEYSQLVERLSFMSRQSTNERRSSEDMNESITHLKISQKEQNILLSCKGLGSKAKVRQYYQPKVINGQKHFLCRWEGCSYRTPKTSKIAHHINLSHFGVQFVCNKPNCNKVFKNPNTYREHQKNHICGFGIFGYGSKGVIGVCRNDNLNKYRERVVIDGQKLYRCTWTLANGSQCLAITKYHMAMKRHSHAHVCPYRKNLKLKHNQKVIHNMKTDVWNLDFGLGAFA